MNRSALRGLALVEVPIALVLVALQVPAVAAIVTTAMSLTRRAEALVAAIDAATASKRSEAP